MTRKFKLVERNLREMDTCHLFLSLRCWLSLPLSKGTVQTSMAQQQGRWNMRIVEPVNIEDRQTLPLKVWRETRWSKKRSMLIGGLLFLFLASSTSAVAGYLVYHTYQTNLVLEQTGMQHLRSAMALLESLQTQPFAPPTVERAQQEFASALS